MSLLIPEVDSIRPTGITRIAVPHLEDPDIIPLWFGEGDQTTAAFIRDAAKQALDDGQTFYANDRGTSDTRAAIKAYLDRCYDIDLNPDRLLMPGSTMLAVTMAVNATLSRGDRALLVGPCWPNIEAAVQMSGAAIDYVSQRPADGVWQLDLDELIGAISEHTRLLYINSPCNPSGWVMSAEQQRQLLDACRERGVTILADEVYHRHVYDGSEVAPSFLSIARDDDPLVVVNGMSKAWAMTGWRLGWMVVPAATIGQFAMMSQCYNTGSATFTQAGAVAALSAQGEGENLARALREQYRGGLGLVMDKLGDHPRVDMARPEGAFYAFPAIRGVRSGMDFAEGLVRAEKVGVSPGYTFGPGNESRIRICFALSHQRLAEALQRIVRYLDSDAVVYDD